MAERILLRHDTASNWSSVNPVLSAGECGLDMTNNIIKIGDGVTAWNSLPAASGSSVSVINNLTSTSTTAALSAYQGKLLNDTIGNINTILEQI